MAMTTYQTELSAASETQRVFMRGMEMLKKAESLINSEVHEGILLTEQAEHVATFAVQSSEESSALIEFAYALRGGLYYRLSRHDDALECSRKSLEITRKTQNKRVESLALNTCGAVYTSLGQYDKALDCHLQSMALRQELQDDVLLAVSLMNVGNVMYVLGDLPHALDYYLRSLHLREQIGDEHGIGVSLGNVGKIYAETGDGKRAIDCLSRSALMKERSGNKQGLIATYGDLALEYVKIQSMEKAKFYAEKSRTIAAEMGIQSGESYAHYLLGKICRQSNDKDNALEELHKSLQLRAQYKEAKGEADTLLALAEIHLDCGDAQSALSILEKALLIAEQLRSSSVLYPIHQALAQCYEQMGNLEVSYRHFKLYHQLKSDILGEYANTRIRNIQTVREVEKTQTESLFFHVQKTALSDANEKAEHFSRELENVNKQLLHSNSVLAELNSNKNELLDIVSHDINNALSSIVHYTSFIEKSRTTLSENELIDYVGKIRRITRRTADIVVRLLNKKSYGEENLISKIENTNISEVVRQAVELHGEYAKEKNIELSLELLESDSIANIDSNMLWEIIDNVLSNAIKLSLPNSKITLRIYSRTQ